MKTLLAFLCLCSSAYGQFYQPYTAPQQFASAAPVFPPYPPYPAPQVCPGGHGGDYQTALIQLIAIQQLLNQQTEVQRGWQDRNSDQLATIIRQQEFARQAVGFREQFDWSRSQVPLPLPQPAPVIIQQQRRRGLFR